ncbi:MAG: OmpA family protein [Bdellovibrionales bacterium]
MRDVLRTYAKKKPSVKSTSHDAAMPGMAAPPLLAPVARPSTSREMMMQGMRSVLRPTNVIPSVPTTVARSVASQNAPAASGLQRELAGLIGSSADLPSSSSPVMQGKLAVGPSATPVTVDGVQYQPGQEPRALGHASMPQLRGGSVGGATTSAVVAPYPQPDARGAGVLPAGPQCAGRATAWVKSCVEAGYPEAFVGQIRGETRTGCDGGGLRDVWVSNTCSPPGDRVERRAATVPLETGLRGAESVRAQADLPVLASASLTSSVSSVASGAVAAKCGAANGAAVSRRPVAEFCDSGQATEVSGDGPWRWSCKGASGGMTVSCAASYAQDSRPESKVEMAVVSSVTAPPSVSVTGIVSQNLDDRDKSGKILDGRCGTAIDIGVDRAPSANLCAQGVASRVSGEGPWSWACSGSNGGAAAACFAPKKSDGFCGSSHGGSFDKMPMAGLCGGGYASAVTGDGPWNWACSGLHGGEAATCSATRVVNAVCGSASLTGHRKVPADQLCSVGQPSSVVGSGPWSWSCSGSHGGSQVACSSPILLDGKCGEANGVALPSAPSENLCAKGSAARVSGDGPWMWSCLGSDGGDSETCTAPRKQEPVVSAVAPSTTSATVLDPSQGKKKEVVTASGAVAGLGMCGSAAELAALVAPDNNLCARGSAGNVSGAGPWNWTCKDDTGVLETCSTLFLAAPPVILAGPSAAGVAHISESARPASGEHASDVPERKPSVPAHGEVAGAFSGADAMPSPLPAPSVPVRSDQPVALVAKSDKAHAVAEVKAACGSSGGQGFSQAPTAGLCESGAVAGLVSGDGPWTWECSNSSSKASCTALKFTRGTCGSSNGAMLDRAPQAELCAEGNATEVYGFGPWLWTCVGAGGGGSSSCSTAAMQQVRVEGVCGTSAQAILSEAPNTNLCDGGLASPVYGSGPWTWTCSGMNGGIASPCTALKSMSGEASAPSAPAAAVDGYCGSANGMAVSEQPVEGLCASGSQTRIVGEGPWNWNCMGLNGGMSVSCTASLLPPPPLDGACGSASGAPALAMPQGGLCASGISSAVSGKGPWTWSCSGINGGGAVGCVAPFAGMSAGANGAMPSLVVPSETIPDAPASGDGANSLLPRGGSSSRDVAVAAPFRSSGGNRLVTPSLKAEVFPPRKPDVVAPYPQATVGIPSSPSRREKEGLAAPLPPVRSAESQALSPPTLRGGNRKLGSSSADGDMAIVPGNHFVLDDDVSVVAFENTDSNLNNDAVEILDKLVSVLTANKGVRVTLTAYAGNKDITPRDARRLSLSRGLAVRDYLSSKGIAAGRMDVRALGSNVPSGDPDRVDVRAN